LTVDLYVRSKIEFDPLVGEFTGVFTNADGNLFSERIRERWAPHRGHQSGPWLVYSSLTCLCANASAYLVVADTHQLSRLLQCGRHMPYTHGAVMRGPLRIPRVYKCTSP
jgi:hypothetical protein